MSRIHQKPEHPWRTCSAVPVQPCVPGLAAVGYPSPPHWSPVAWGCRAGCGTHEPKEGPAIGSCTPTHHINTDKWKLYKERVTQTVCSTEHATVSRLQLERHVPVTTSPGGVCAGGCAMLAATGEGKSQLAGSFALQPVLSSWLTVQPGPPVCQGGSCGISQPSIAHTDRCLQDKTSSKHSTSDGWMCITLPLCTTEPLAIHQ